MSLQRSGLAHGADLSVQSAGAPRHAGPDLTCAIKYESEPLQQFHFDTRSDAFDLAALYADVYDDAGDCRFVHGNVDLAHQVLDPLSDRVGSLVAGALFHGRILFA